MVRRNWRVQGLVCPDCEGFVYHSKMVCYNAHCRNCWIVINKEKLKKVEDNNK